MTQFLDTPVDKSLGATGAWTDIDLSGDVPASATGAIFRVVNTGTEKSYGLRKNGSTDDRYKDLNDLKQQYALIGLDANRICEGKIEATSIDFFLIGYTESDVTFFTNATYKTFATSGAWTDIDLSSNIAAGATAAIFEVVNIGGTAKNGGLRKNGSTDNRHPDLYAQGHSFIIVGVDATRKCEGYKENTAVLFYLLGYLTMGQAETNAVDKSLGSTGSYVDIDESGNAPVGATGVFGELISTGAYKFAARKNGTSFDYYEDCMTHDSIMAGLDANRKWEGKIENVAVDFFTMGYFVAEPVEKTSSDTGIGADGVPSVVAAVQKSDLGSGTEELQELIGTLLQSEVGVGAEVTVEIGLSGADTGAGAEVTVEIGLSGADTGVGVEASLVWIYLILKLLQNKKEINLKLSQPRK